MEISMGTLLALGETFEKTKTNNFPFFFSGDTEILITCNLYVDLATGQFMESHNICPCATEDTICQI